MYKKLLTILFPLIVFASIAAPAFAQTENRLKGNECLYEDSVVTMKCIMPLFANAVYWLFIMSGVVAVFFIAYGGIKYLTSSGEAKAVESARKVITWAIIGLITIILSFTIANIIADLTKVNCITDFGFTACGLSSSTDPTSRTCGEAGGSCYKYECSSGDTPTDGTCRGTDMVCCIDNSPKSCGEIGGDCYKYDCPTDYTPKDGTCGGTDMVCCSYGRVRGGEW